ncbi:MAG TPA: hypothetical protein PLK37_05805 [Terricaulis sp.]|nr:hypothetical protein [Terricaulis sp.]
MTAAFEILLFTLERVRTIVTALAFIILIKLAFVLCLSAWPN